MQPYLQLSFEIPFIVRIGNVSVVRERVKLVCYSTAHSAFCRVESDLLYECSVRCTIRRAHVLSTLTSNQFELQRSLIRINFLLAEIFRTSSPWNLETFIRTSGLQNSLALGLQKLQVFGCWRRSSELPVFKIFST